MKRYEESFDYIAAMEEENESGFEKDIADVKRRLHDCRAKYQDTEMKIKETLWSSCASGQYGDLTAGLKDAFEWADTLQPGHITSEQYDLVHTALQSRVEALEEFVRDWERCVPGK